MWQEQINSINSFAKLKEVFPSMQITQGMLDAEKLFHMAITPYYASLIKTPDFSDPIFAQCVPSEKELLKTNWTSNDPLLEQESSPIPKLIRRYFDRALILSTSSCASYCRHCMRKRESSKCVESISASELADIASFLSKNPEIEDVLVSGGDPLTLEDDKIGGILKALEAVDSVKTIRIATRVPVTMPMRITDSLIKMMKIKKPVFVNTHFNHPVEITERAVFATGLFIDNGIPVSNQTVLLNGVNDSPQTIETLCRKLYRNRIRPYYLFQCDPVEGVEHFRTKLQTGIDIMKYLRENLSGMAIPHFAVDIPNSGKIELLPDSIVESTDKYTVLMSSSNKKIIYPEP